MDSLREVDIKKLESHGFILKNMTEKEIEELRQCYISISDSEEFAGLYSDIARSVSIKSENQVQYVRNQPVVSGYQSLKGSKAYEEQLNYNASDVDLDYRSKPNNPFNAKESNESMIRNSKYLPSKQAEPMIKTSNSNSKGKTLKSTKPAHLENFKSNKDTSKPFFDLNKLMLDPEDYAQLKNRGMKELSINEVYSMKIYEKFDTLNSELQETRKMYYQYRQEKLALTEENAILKLEKEKISKTNSVVIEAINIKISTLETDNARLKELSNLQERKLTEAYPKLQRYEELSSQISKLQRECNEHIENLTKTTSINQALQKEKNELASKNESQRYELESFSRDKLYLNKELLMKDERILTITEKNKTLEVELTDTRKANHKYIDKLTDKSSHIESMYEDKLKSEIQEIKGKYNNDLENLKKMYEDLNNTRTQYLIEERNDLKIKVSKLETDLKEKLSSYDFLSSEFRKFKSSSNEEMSYLKIQMRLKSEDYDRLSNLHEENLSLVKLLKAENESYKEKHDIFRIELINRESLFREETCNLKAELAILKESKSHYDKIEDELDKIIVDSSLGEG